jgi:F-box/leucine-rich repeat protein 2/20
MEPIRELHLDDLPNELLHFVLEYLEKPDLTALAVASPRFSGVIWSLLRRLKISLKKIETDAGSLLKQCSELRYLEVSDGPNWQIESLAALPNPSYLTQLVLRNCDKFRLYDGSLEYYFPKLETVHFISCPGVGDSALPWIPKHIKDLSLENCRKISDEGLALLPKHCTALTGLDLKGCYRLSGDGLVNCLTQLTQLKHIVLAKLYKLGDEHLEKITKQCSQLENVDIRFLKIEDRGLRAIEENCKNLKEIHLKFCTVTNPGVISLLTHSTKLVNIDLQGKSRLLVTTHR